MIGFRRNASRPGLAAGAGAPEKCAAHADACYAVVLLAFDLAHAPLSADRAAMLERLAFSVRAVEVYSNPALYELACSVYLEAGKFIRFQGGPGDLIEARRVYWAAVHDCVM